VLQHDCQEFLALLLDSLHEHLNAPCVSLKLTSGDDSPSFSRSESSDADAEMDDWIGTENTPVASALSVPDESLGRVVNSSEQMSVEVLIGESSVLDDVEMNTELSPNCIVMDTAASMEHSESASVDDCGRKVPSIEDFCSKDTKTLNTNVLIAETNEELAVDSEKFHKVENTTELCVSPESLEDDVASGDHLRDLLLAACDGSVSKPVKETNLIANCREKFVDSVKMAANPVVVYAQTASVDIDCFIASMKEFCGKPPGSATEQDEDDVQNYDNINNIKRIKIDDQAEKNLRMQVRYTDECRYAIQTSAGTPYRRGWMFLL